MLKGAATVLTVRDVAASVAHYRDALGFVVNFEWGQPATYACLCRDAVDVHLVAEAIAKRPAGHGAICVFVDDVDAVHTELVARGAGVVKAPQDYEYGMRDFDVRDLDGNALIFGMAVEN